MTELRATSDPSGTDPDKPLLYVCYAPADHAWVHGRMLPALGLRHSQYLTRADDALGELQLVEIQRAVDQCRFTVLIASSAARWDKLAQFAAMLAQHAGLEQDTPRLIIIARDFALGSEVGQAQLSLGQRALVGLDCSDEPNTVEALVRLRKLLGAETALEEPTDPPPLCPYPGLSRFTAANRDLLFGRDRDKDALLSRIRGRHSRILVVGPSGSGKSSLVHAAVLPELSSGDHVVQVVPRGGNLAAALRRTTDALEVPGLGAALDAYLEAVRGTIDAQIEQARARLRTVPMPDARRRIVVVDPLEEIFAEDDAVVCETLFLLLGGLWSVPWCTVILCMRADFYGALMIQRCWRELENSQYAVAPLDEAGLRAAIVEPAKRAGVHVDVALVERLIREIDRDRSSVPLPLLQVALKELWAHLRWRYLTLAAYERIVNHDQRGLAAVLAVHADAVVQALTAPGDRSVAQRIMLDLVHLGEGRPHTRRRRTIDDLRRSGDAPDQLERVLEKLVEGRLVTTGDGDLSATHTEGRPVDLAHDALISGWGELAAWIKDRQGDLIKQRRLETWAREWDEGGRTRGLLDEGDKAEARAWKDSSGGKALGVSQRLVDLIAASESEHTRIRREKEALLARLLAEQRKTRASMVAAVQVANEIVFQVDTKLRTVAGASSVREVLLARSRNLFQDLRAIGGFEADAQRTEMAAKSAQANFALERGRLDEARRLFRQVHEHAQRETAADPDNHGWKRALAVSYSGLGDVAVAIGELDDARAWFDKALAVAEGIANDDPADTTWQRDLSVSYNKLGDVAVAMGKLDDARVWFEKSLTVVKMLAAADPTNTAWQHDLSISQNKLGDIAAAAGKLEDARAWFDNAIVIAKALTAADPTNTTWQRDLSLSYVRLGDVAVAAGKLDDARAWFNKDLVVAKMLAAADSTNTTWQRDLSVSYDRLGHVAMAAGNLNDARIRFDKALAIRETLAATDSTNTTWQRDLSVSYDRLGHVAMAARNFDDARAWFDKDLAVAKALAAADPTNASWQRDLCNTLAKIAQVARDANETRRYLDKARVIYDELQRSSFFQHDIQFTQLGTFLEQLAARIDTVKSVDTISLSYEGAIAIARL